MLFSVDLFTKESILLTVWFIASNLKAKLKVYTMNMIWAVRQCFFQMEQYITVRPNPFVI